MLVYKKRKTSVHLLLLVLLTCVGANIWGNTLDRQHISTLYFDGEFPSVIEKLEAYRKANPNLTDSEKIFIFKYLSVVYTADPNTRENGESYMYQLLKIVPSVELIDMYVSDNIRAIFQNVKSEYQKRLEYAKSKNEIEKTPEAQTSSSPASVKNKGRKPTPTSNSGSKKWVWWTVGGTAVVAGVVAFVVLGSAGDKPNRTTYNMP